MALQCHVRKRNILLQLQRSNRHSLRISVPHRTLCHWQIMMTSSIVSLSFPTNEAIYLSHQFNSIPEFPTWKIWTPNYELEARSLPAHGSSALSVLFATRFDGGLLYPFPSTINLHASYLRSVSTVSAVLLYTCAGCIYSHSLFTAHCDLMSSLSIFITLTFIRDCSGDSWLLLDK